MGLIALASQTAQADPPFSGTIFIDPDIITSSDPTTFQSVSYVGQDMRLMFDRRVNDWIHVNAYLFDASFDDGLTSEIQVNPEFRSPDAAMTVAQTYGTVIGRLPTALRADVQTVWIHRGIEPFGGGNNNLLIHTGQADRYATDGILEETLVHEAAHTSLDASHASARGWLAAQNADDEFISTYARDFPQREDIAESFLPYLAVRYRADRISQSLADTILQTIPNRIDYFDDQSFDMYPLLDPTLPTVGDTNGDGMVDLDDLNNVRNNFGAMGADDGTLPGDAYPFDGMVDIDDLNGVRNNFGALSAPVPEPSTLALALLFTLAAVVARPRRQVALRS